MPGPVSVTTSRARSPARWTATVIEPGRIRLVDFKTARRPPEGVSQVPVAILRQMAAYAAALEAAYPGREVEAALLYTAAPRLIALPRDLIEAHKPDLAGQQ